MFNKSKTQISGKDKQFFYVIGIIFIISSLFYISNEYIYSKKNYTYTVFDVDTNTFLNENSEISIENEIYPSNASLSFSDFLGYNITNLYDLKTEKIIDSVILNSSLESISLPSFSDLNTSSYSNSALFNYTKTSEIGFEVNATNSAGWANAVKNLNQTYNPTTKTFYWSFWIYIPVQTNNMELELTLRESGSDTNKMGVGFFSNGHSIKTIYGSTKTTIGCYTSLVWNFVMIKFDSSNMYVYVNQTLIGQRSCYQKNFAQFINWNAYVTPSSIFKYFIVTTDIAEANITNNMADIHTLNKNFAINLTDSSENLVNFTLISELNNLTNCDVSIFNVFNNEYDSLNSSFYSNSPKNYINSNNSLNISLYCIGNTSFSITFSFSINVTYFEGDFYDLFVKFDLENIDFRINNIRLLEYSFSIVLTEITNYQFSCNQSIYFTLVIIKSWEVTEVVEN